MNEQTCSNCLYNYDNTCIYWQECNKQLKTVPNGHCDNWEEEYQLTINQIREILRKK